MCWRKFFHSQRVVASQMWTPCSRARAFPGTAGTSGQPQDGHQANGGQPQQSGTRAAAGKGEDKDTVAGVFHMRDLSRYHDGWLNRILLIACTFGNILIVGVLM